MIVMTKGMDSDHGLGCHRLNYNMHGYMILEELLSNSSSEFLT